MTVRRARPVLLPVAVMALALSTAACSSGTGAEAKEDPGVQSVTIGTVVDKTFEPAVTPKIAKEIGCFEKEGLDAKIIAFNGGSDASKGLISGVADIGSVTGLEAMSATANGAPLKMFWGTAQISPMVLIAKPGSGIESGSDLVGKRVGVTKFGSLTDYLVRQLATKLGEPGSIKSVALGGPPEQMAALERGDIEAFIWSTDVGFSLEMAGKAKIIDRFADLNGTNDQYAGLDAIPEYLEEHPDIAAGVARAYQCGINWMQDEANFEAGSTYTAQFLGVDQEVAAKTYQEIVGHLTPNGEINTEALETLASSLPDLGIAKEVPDLDTYYTDEIQKMVEDSK